MEFKAVIKKSQGWWIGCLVDLHGINGQEKRKKKLLEYLKIGAEDMLNTPFEPTEKEQLVKIEV